MIVVWQSNDVDILFECIKEIYCQSVMQSLAKDLVFKSFKLHTTEKAHDQIANIEKRFLDNVEEMNYLNLSIFNPRKYYKFEIK